MGHKEHEKVIGEIFIKEYNRVNNCQFIVDEEYLLGRNDNHFPDLKFINGGDLFAEVVRAVSPKIEKNKNNFDDLDLIEVDPSEEFFLALKKKVDKNYAGSKDILLLIHLPFYSEQFEIKALAPAVKNNGYNFREIWGVWDCPKKQPIKLT